MSSRNNSSRLQRWALQLQEYDFFVETRVGKANCNADVLLRIPSAGCQEEEGVKEVNLIQLESSDKSKDATIYMLAIDLP